MIFQILDRQFNTLATMDNSLTGAIHFFDDEFHQYLNEGMSTLEFSVLRDHADVEYLVEGNYIQFTYKSRDYLMTIRRIEEDEWQLNISTEDLSFDLINEHAPAYTAPAARKITDYLKDILADSDVVIGLNEVSNYTRKLEWTGESTVLERVLSIMTKFDAECEFITELNNDRSLKQITLNIYHKYDDTHQGVGVNRSDIELRLGENVKTVQKTTDITELYTSIKPVGNDGLSIKNIEETITDDGGNVLYYTKKGSEYIFAPVANARFGRKNAEKGGYINMPYEFDTDSVATLYGNALSQLKKYSEPAVTYEVDGYYDLDIGDVVSIADNRYSPILLLEARAAEMIISFSNPENNKTIFSNYRVFDSQISSDLLKLMEQMKSDVDYAVQVANTPIFNITSKGSTAFKNGDGSVELTASIERANTDVTNEYTIFNWVKQNKDGSNDTEWTEAHKNQGKSITITPDDFVDTATFHYETEKDSKLYVGGSATVVKVYDGEDGKTPIKGVDYFDGKPGTNGLSAYLHVRYSQNANGNPMTSDPTNAVYLGLLVSQNPTASTVPADYDWSMVKGPQGIPGETVNGKTSYLHIKYSNDGGKTFTGNSGEDAGSYLGQYVDFESADSTDVKKYAWSRIEGETPVVHNAYAWSADGTDRFTTKYPSENLLNVLNSEKVVKRDGVGIGVANSVGYYWSLNDTWAGLGLKLGDILTTSFDIKVTNDSEVPLSGMFRLQTNNPWNNLFESFQLSTVGVGETRLSFSTAIDRSSWLSSTNKQIGIRLDYVPEGISIEVTKLVISIDGAGIYTPSPLDDFENAYPTYSGTYTDYTAQDSQNPADYTWTRILGKSGQDGKDGIAGKDGVGIKSTTVTYALSDSGTTAPTSGWTATVPTLIKGKYLWTKSVWTYTDNSTETGYSVTYVAKDGNDGQDGLAGKDGVGIQSTAISYAKSDSGITAPTTGWTTTVPSVPEGQYLWTKTVWTYTDNTSETGYSVAKMGANGSDGTDGQDGVGIASTAITYQASASGTTAPSGTWSTTIPNVPAGQFLWTKTVTTYTNNTNSTAFTVAKMGSDGKPGSAGVSVSSVVEEYYVSTSPTSQAGGSWSTTVPNNADPNKYIWRRLKTTMSDSTVTYTNPALIQGMTGIYPYIGPTQPANPKEGQQWWKSDSSGNITNFFVYKSGSWQGQTIQQSVLNIIELNAVRILGSIITGTTINTSVLNNSGTYQDSGATILYNSTYNGNITSDWAVENSTQNGTFILSPRNLAAISYTDAARKNPGWHWVIDNNGIDVGNPSYSAIYGGEGITIYNAQLSPTYGRVKLEFQDLMSMPPTLIPASSGWTQYATARSNAPMASRQGRVVQLSGAFKNNGIVAPGDGATMGLLPVWARPSRDVNTISQASYNNRYLLTIKANGEISMSRHSADGTDLKVGAGSWLNIAITYAAGDL